MLLTVLEAVVSSSGAIVLMKSLVAVKLVASFDMDDSDRTFAEVVRSSRFVVVGEAVSPEFSKVTELFSTSVLTRSAAREISDMLEASTLVSDKTVLSVVLGFDSTVLNSRVVLALSSLCEGLTSELLMTGLADSDILASRSVLAMSDMLGIITSVLNVALVSLGAAGL